MTPEQTVDNNQMTVGKWVGTLILTFIPLVNIVVLCIWAFGKEDVRRNYSRALLTIYSILIGLSLIVGISQITKNVNESGGSSTTIDYAAMENYHEDVLNGLNNNLEILEVQLMEQNGLLDIVGKVRNKSTSETFSRFVILANLYDKDGTMIMSKRIRVKDSIPPGETYKFTEWANHTESYSVKVVGIDQMNLGDNY